MIREWKTKYREIKKAINWFQHNFFQDIPSYSLLWCADFAQCLSVYTIYLFIFYKSNKSNTHRVQRMKIPAFSYPAWNYGDSSKYDCGKCTPSYGLWLAWGRYGKKEERKKIWYILVTLLYTWWTVNCIASAPMRGSEWEEKMLEFVVATYDSKIWWGIRLWGINSHFASLFHKLCDLKNGKLCAHENEIVWNRQAKMQ